MERNRSSLTAEGIALVRAMETSRPAAVRICNDPLARQMISGPFYLMGRLFSGYGENRAPGTQGYLAVRTRFIDDYLLSCVGDGIQQLVILGAGLDSRPYRFDQLKKGVRVLEVDHPATQAAKKEKLRKILGALPGRVTFVPIDFNQQSLAEIIGFGYDEHARTLFIWEGVTYYLQPDAVDATLQFVATRAAPGSSIVFDYVYAEALTAARKRGEIARMQRYSRFSGEGLVFGIAEGQVGEYLAARGFTDVVNMTGEDLKSAYFTGANANRAVAPVYAIVHATVKGS